MAIIKLWRDNEKERWWVSEPVDEIMTHVLFFFKSSEREREIERERETLNVSHGIPRLWGRVYITTETYTHALSHTHTQKRHTQSFLNLKSKKQKKQTTKQNVVWEWKRLLKNVLRENRQDSAHFVFFRGNILEHKLGATLRTHTHTVQHTTSSGMLSHVSVTHNNTKKECSSEGMSYVTERLCVFIFFFFTLMLMCCCRRHQKGFIW